MELKTYLRILRQHLALIIAAAVVGALGGLAVAVLAPTTYTSETQLFVSIPGAGNVADLQQGSTFTQERMQTYVEMATSRAVLTEVITDLGLDDTPEELSARVQARTDPQTVLITIEATDPSPEQASRIAETTAAQLVEVIGDLENPEESGASPVRLSVAEAADVPGQPSSLSVWLDMLLGLLVGAALGVAIAFLRVALDNRLRGKADLRSLTGAPVLTSVPADSTTARTPLITDVPRHSPRAEAFRRLRTNLRFAQVDDATNSLLVTSAMAGEGKSTTSVNLAIVMAQAGQRVALVDADLRRPRIAEHLGLENAAGLTTALLGAADVSELMQAWGDDELYVLTAGEIPPNPAELLDSRAMSRLLGQLMAEFDLVVVDGPPLLPVADGLILAQEVGRVLLVAGVGEVRTSDVQEALNSLQLVEATRVGVVLNKVPASSHEMTGYTRGYAEAPRPSVPAARRRGARAPEGTGDSGTAPLPVDPDAVEAAPAPTRRQVHQSRRRDRPALARRPQALRAHQVES